MHLDELDNRLIDALLADGRATVRDLAKRLGARPSTVHARMRRLLDAKVIDRFTCKLDNRAFGQDLIVFMLVSTVRDLDAAALADRNIKEVYGITGEYDLLLKLKFPGIEEFNRFVISFRKNPAVRRTHTLVVTLPIREELH
ncbi:Lrp/AsnC family transcriptional regulator [Candidatus Woesearchaeota archaeon]|nr:Lrp/AsnC family transcriptional regulator [Candidatus Woesearchaeota archaeon]